MRQTLPDYWETKSHALLIAWAAASALDHNPSLRFSGRKHEVRRLGRLGNRIQGTPCNETPVFLFFFFPSSPDHALLFIPAKRCPASDSLLQARILSAKTNVVSNR